MVGVFFSCDVSASVAGEAFLLFAGRLGASRLPASLVENRSLGRGGLGIYFILPFPSYFLYNTGLGRVL